MLNSSYQQLLSTFCSLQQAIMSYWCPKSQGATSDIYSKKSVLTQIIKVKDISSWDLIQKRLETHPHEAREKDKFGVTALHHVIRKYQKNGSIGDDDAANTSDADAVVPIEMFVLLIEGCPDSLEVCDRMTGCNALHLACAATTCDDKMRKVIMMILNKRNDGASTTSGDGRLPLHRCKDIEVAKRLVKIYPEGVSKRTYHCGTVFDKSKGFS